MAYCSNCGRRLYSDDNYCSGCGRPVSQVSVGNLSSGSAYTPAVTEGRRSPKTVTTASTRQAPSWSASAKDSGNLPQLPDHPARLAKTIVISVTILIIVAFVVTFGSVFSRFF